MANRKKSKTIINVGVDIGKQFLDVHIYEKALYWQEENNDQGIQSLLVIFFVGHSRYTILKTRLIIAPAPATEITVSTGAITL